MPGQRRRRCIWVYATGREYALPVDVKVIGDGIYRLNHRKMP